MKAICVVKETNLEVQDTEKPSTASHENLLVQMEASGINSGDKYFLANPAARAAFGTQPNNVWGASGVGRVIGVGKNVPSHYKDKRVAIYRSLRRTPDTIGLWSEVAQIHHLCCLVLPENLNAIDYSGSLVNIITAYAFLNQAKDDGHKGVVTTAGNSATGRALLELARGKDIPAIALVRSAQAKKELGELGFTNVIDTSVESFGAELQTLAQQLGTTGIFDGVGGDIVTRIAPVLPRTSAFYFYGFLAGPEAFSIQSLLMMEKSLTMRSFSNFMTRTVQDNDALSKTFEELTTIIERPAFRTKVGAQFKFDEIHKAMQFKGNDGAKALLIP
jgi:NADPH2:quinone reductase